MRAGFLLSLGLASCQLTPDPACVKSLQVAPIPAELLQTYVRLGMKPQGGAVRLNAEKASPRGTRFTLTLGGVAPLHGVLDGARPFIEPPVLDCEPGGCGEPILAVNGAQAAFVRCGGSAVTITMTVEERLGLQVYQAGAPTAVSYYNVVLADGGATPLEVSTTSATPRWFVGY